MALEMIDGTFRQTNLTNESDTAHPSLSSDIKERGLWYAPFTMSSISPPTGAVIGMRI